MDDAQILKQISTFVDEEHALYRKSEKDGGLDGTDRQRLDQLKVALDQAWDLLDQRRGLREAGRSPNDAKLRDAATVENYEQ
jgi:hypothetical protein